jgi:hypothetical protein
MPTAYCFKCRQKREIKDPRQVTLKNGRPATQGTCPVCGTKVFRMRKAYRWGMAKLPKLPSFLTRIIKKRRRGAERGRRKPRIVPPTKQRKV